jgi:hypothetical protein
MDPALLVTSAGNIRRRAWLCSIEFLKVDSRQDAENAKENKLTVSNLAFLAPWWLSHDPGLDGPGWTAAFVCRDFRLVLKREAYVVKTV